MTCRPHLCLSLLLQLSSALASSALEYLCRFPTEQQVILSGLAADRIGNSYLCGYTAQPAGLPGSVLLGATNFAEGDWQAFLMKLAPDGTRLATIVFGGEGADQAMQVAVDPSGNVVVAGRTASRHFPLLRPLRGSLGGGSDIFLCKFDSTCTNLVFSTYVGGSDEEFPSALGLDSQGEIYFAGATYSDDFFAGTDPFPWRAYPLTAFLARLAADGSELRFAVRVGGSGSDAISALAVDGQDNVCLAGITRSLDFPTTNALQPAKPFSSQSSAFVMKVAPDGAAVFSTYLGGEFDDTAECLAVNGAGEIFVGGRTFSQRFPALELEPPTPPTNRLNRAFLVKLDPAGAQILDARFHVSTGYDSFRAAAISPGDQAVAIGNGLGGIGLPFFARLDGMGKLVTVPARVGCEALASVAALAFDALGRLLVIGQELGPDYPGVSQYAAFYEPLEWQGTSAPQVRILSPLTGRQVPVRQALSLQAAVVGGTGEVSSVKFYDGRRLLGVATDLPFNVSWKSVSPGKHQLTAVATVGGRAVTSCVVNVTAASPKNDDFARRRTLKGDNVEVLGDLAGASAEGYPESEWAPSVWYSWKAPRDGLYRLELFELPATTASSFQLAIYTGSQREGLVEVTSPGSTAATLRTRRGDAFQIRVTGFSPDAGRFGLRIRTVTPPVNDSFEHPVMLNGETVSVTATTRDATGDPGASYGQPYFGDAGTPSVWFSWTAPASGLFLATVSGAGYLPVVSSYTGTTISNLVSVGQPISGETNGVAFYAQAGTGYLLSLSGENTNDLVLALHPYEPPANDNFADRFAIPFRMNAATGTLIGATREPGEPGGMFPPRLSVWWTWQPPTDGIYRVIVTPFTVPVAGPVGGPASVRRAFQQVQVYTGATIGQLIPAANASPVGELVFHAVAGTNYPIAVMGGEARFALRLNPVAAPRNDDFVAAIELAGPLVAIAGSTLGATSEPGEPARGLGSPGASNTDSVWYRWTAPSNGVFSFSASSVGSLAGASLLEIYQGETLAGLIPLATGANGHVLRVTGGAEYRLAVVSGRSFALLIQPARPPANDDFANRQLISGLNVSFAVDTRDATVESGEYSPTRHSVWFTWTAPARGSYRVWSTNYVSPRISVYTGDSLTALTPVASGQNLSGLEFTAEAGTTYQLAVEPGYYPGQFGLDLRYVPPPRNDNFANRLRLKGSPVSITASNAGATLEAGEPFDSTWAGGQTVWWRWRAPREGRASFAVENGSAILRLFNGSSLAQLTALTATNEAQSEHNLAVHAGVDYLLCVDRWSWAPSGPFRLGIHYTSPPPNDDFARRQAFDTLATGNMEGASLEAGEPEVDSPSATGSVWWSWTAPSNGTYVLTVTSPTAAPRLEIFTGTALDGLQRVQTDPSYASYSVSAQVAAGTTYVIRLQGSGVSAPYTLKALFAPAPINDNFADRLVLSGTSFSVTGSNRTATAEFGEPDHGGSAARKSVWWSWLAPSGGVAKIAVVFPGFSSHRLAVYAGDSLAGLQAVTNGNGAVRFEAQPGTVYQIALDTERWSPQGSDEFIWSLALEATLPPPAPSAREEENLPPPPAAPMPIILASESGPAANNATIAPLIIETSTNLLDWVPYTNGPANPAEFRVVPATNEPQRFFRIRR